MVFILRHFLTIIFELKSTLSQLLQTFRKKNGEELERK